VDGGSQGRAHPEHEASITRGFACESFLTCTAACDTPVRLWPPIPGAACDCATTSSEDAAAARVLTGRSRVVLVCGSRCLRSARCPLRYLLAAVVCAAAAELGWFNGLRPRPGLAGAVVGGSFSRSSPGLGKHVRPVLCTTVDLFVGFITRYVLLDSAFQTTNPGRARRLRGVGSR
jgi:hypothetical protein